MLFLKSKKCFNSKNKKNKILMQWKTAYTRILVVEYMNGLRAPEDKFHLNANLHEAISAHLLALHACLNACT